MTVLYEDIEKIDDYRKEDLAKCGYKPDKMYNSLIDLFKYRTDSSEFNTLIHI
jgi:hypothetical protein